MGCVEAMIPAGTRTTPRPIVMEVKLGVDIPSTDGVRGFVGGVKENRGSDCRRQKKNSLCLEKRKENLFFTAFHNNKRVSFISKEPRMKGETLKEELPFRGGKILLGKLKTLTRGGKELKRRTSCSRPTSNPFYKKKPQCRKDTCRGARRAP